MTEEVEKDPLAIAPPGAKKCQPSQDPEQFLIVLIEDLAQPTDGKPAGFTVVARASNASAAEGAAAALAGADEENREYGVFEKRRVAHAERVIKWTRAT